MHIYVIESGSCCIRRNDETEAEKIFIGAEPMRLHLLKNCGDLSLLSKMGFG